MFKLKYLTKSIYTIIVFFTITLFSSLSISTFQSILTDSITSGNYINNTATSCNLLDVNKISKEEFLQCIKSTPNIYIEKNNLQPGAFLGKAIYFKKNPMVIPSMISGDYFTETNFTSSEPAAIVGKDVLKTAKKINGNKYFAYENVQYKIIGVMGYENRSSLCDLEFIINLNAYIQNTPSSLSTSNYLIDSNVNAKETFNTFITNLKNINPDINYKNISNKGSKTLIDTFISQGLNTLIIFSVMLFLIFINVFNITLQWIERKKKTIGIKKALGGTNFRISLESI
jgi:putative ABC transport system permease protein